MSLRAFHVLFIVASILLALTLAGWGLVRYADGGAQGLWLAVAGLAGAVVLVVYAWRVFGKLQEAEGRP